MQNAMWLPLLPPNMDRRFKQGNLLVELELKRTVKDSYKTLSDSVATPNDVVWLLLFVFVYWL